MPQVHAVVARVERTSSAAAEAAAAVVALPPLLPPIWHAARDQVDQEGDHGAAEPEHAQVG